MMETDVPQVSALLTITGVTIVTVIIVEVIKRALQMSSAALDRWGPLVSIGVASVLALLALFVVNGTAISGESVLQAFLVGIMGGAAASGIYGTVKSNGGAS
jgi:hypothetical protein